MGRTVLNLFDQHCSEEPYHDAFRNRIKANSSPSSKQGEMIAPLPSGDFDADQSSSSEKMANDERSGDRVGKDSQILKMSAILNQIWKDDLNSGSTLVTLFELFGEGILSFIPAPEMSLFL
ncbi:hypothetical protein CRYUN_Cryun23aG0041700 [Craigia yunnanensis]